MDYTLKDGTRLHFNADLPVAGDIQIYYVPNDAHDVLVQGTYQGLLGWYVAGKEEKIDDHLDMLYELSGGTMNASFDKRPLSLE